MSFHRNVFEGVLSALDGRRLRLIVMPTEKCNFRCTYCYEDFEHGQMSPAHVEAVCALIARRAEDLDTLEIDWFGGEPLLAPSVVEKVCRHAQTCADGRFRYRSSITTNGYLLTPDLLGRLVELGVRSYQISLDGWGSTHDRTRVKKGGGGSFATIWSNLLAAQATDHHFKISLRVHFSPTNWSELPSLVQALRTQFRGDPRFSIFFKAVGHYGGKGDKNTKVFSPKDQAVAHKQLTALIGSDVPSSFVDSQRTYVCYASQPNSLVIRANGDLAKCTVALNDERNRIGQLRHDGTLAMKDERAQSWFEGLETMDPATLSCPLGAVSKTPPIRAATEAGRVRLSVLP